MFKSNSSFFSFFVAFWSRRKLIKRKPLLKPYEFHVVHENESHFLSSDTRSLGRVVPRTSSKMTDAKKGRDESVKMGEDEYCKKVSGLIH